MAFVKNLLRLVPISILHGALQVCAMVSIQVGEDAVLVLEAAVSVDRWCVLHSSHSTLLLAILGDSLSRSGGGEGASSDFRNGVRGGAGAQSGLAGRVAQHCGWS